MRKIWYLMAVVALLSVLYRWWQDGLADDRWVADMAARGCVLIVAPQHPVTRNGEPLDGWRCPDGSSLWRSR